MINPNIKYKTTVDGISMVGTIRPVNDGYYYLFPENTNDTIVLNGNTTKPLLFTWALDKNGVEIYHMDVVIHKNTEKIVLWDRKHLCFVLYWYHEYSESMDGECDNGGGFLFTKLTANNAAKCEVVVYS